MAIMAKKSKNVKAVLDVTSDGASLDESVGIESEQVKPKKKKKKSEKEIPDMSVDATRESLDPEAVEKSTKKEKKKKSKIEKSEAKVENIKECTAEVNSDDVNKTEKKKNEKLSNGNSSTGGSSTLNGGEKVFRKEKSSIRSSKQRLQADHDYIVSFFEAMHIPKHKKDGEEDEWEEEDDGIETKEEKEKRIKPGGTKRAASSHELRERLQAKLEQLRGKKLGVFESKRQKKLKQKIASIEKKKLADQEMKQKLMTIGKNAGNLNKVINKEVESTGAKVLKPGVKTEKGVVFSKFDFKDDMIPKEAKKSLDPQAALNKLKKNQEKIKLWEEKGKHDKAKTIENNIAWENAIGKAQGEKVKDDEFLLKKSIQKQKQIKKSSKKKWEARAEGVKAKGNAAADKRDGNISKRKKEKHAKKMKTLSARGRNVPGS